MKRIVYSLFVMALTVNLIVSCKDDDDDLNKYQRTPSGDGSSETKGVDPIVEANRFVYEIMSEDYLWYKEMPKLNYKTQSNTEEYFYNLLYSGDRFSFITDDAEGYLNEEKGESTDMGWDFLLTRASANSNRVVSIINYVYKDTPAYNAGARRGDVIIAVDGKEMSVDNYRMFYATSAKYTVWRYNAEKAAADPDDPYDELEYSITAAEINCSPIAENAIFTVDGKKVGYLLYMNYYSHFNDEMTKVFENFKSEGVSELILDLRYNPGGEMTALAHLCSLIAPQSNVANEDIIVYYKFNDVLSAKDGYGKEESACRFDKKLASKSLDLKNVVILCGTGSYSASEATILGLSPYVNVTTIGDVTGGKNTSMIVSTPDDYYYIENGVKKPYFDKSINNWLIAPIVAQFCNVADTTFDTSNNCGMTPKFVINEYSSDNMGQLGDADEPLTALALKFIAEGEEAFAGNKAWGLTRKMEVFGLSERPGGSIIEKPADPIWPPRVSPIWPPRVEESDVEE